MKKYLKKFGLIIVIFCSFLVYGISFSGECTKNEIIKLADKGFDKAEIKKICEQDEKNTIKWLIPTEKACKEEGGRFKDNHCTSSYSDAHRICFSMNGRRPKLKELMNARRNCDKEDSYNYRKGDSYKECLKNSGFTLEPYWSRTKVKDTDFFVTKRYVLYFGTGNKGEYNVNLHRSAVACVVNSEDGFSDSIHKAYKFIGSFNEE